MDKAGELRECASHCIPLGIMQGSAFSFEPYVYDLSSLHSLIAYSDGLIEQENTSGQCIAQAGLKKHLNELYSRDHSWREIADIFHDHRGDNALTDDVTLCVLDFDQLGFDSDAGAVLSDDRAGDVEFVLSIKGDYLKQVDAPAFVSKFLYAAGIEGKMAGKTFTALAELYQNGLDHGVLALSSELKNDIEGFAAYMEQREQRMNSLNADDEVQLKIRYSADGGVVATVIDSGAGYDTNRHTNSDEALHGRGLTLVKQLAEKFDTNQDGNQVQIVIKE
jgi:hypothetical protein